jgi:hypothetical protein
MGKGFCGKPVFTPKGGRVSRGGGSVGVWKRVVWTGQRGRSNERGGGSDCERAPPPAVCGRLRVRGFRGFGGGGQVREAERGEVG